MHLTGFDYYLIVINSIGFILFAINTGLYRWTDDKHIDPLITISCLLGGSLGILISMLIFDRKAVKGNMMSRVFLISIFVIQIVIFLVIKGYIRNSINLKLLTFFREHREFLVYLMCINAVTFVTYAMDKIFAIQGMWRIRVVFLLFLAFIGGSIGALCAMYIFRHKTRKDYFTIGVPLILTAQVILIVYLMNSPWIK